jgi:hypothetical protein
LEFKTETEHMNDVNLDHVDVSEPARIAIWIQDGNIVGVRSNISSDIEFEIIDCELDDVEGQEVATGRWEELQLELEFDNFETYPF